MATGRTTEIAATRIVDHNLTNTNAQQYTLLVHIGDTQLSYATLHNKSATLTSLVCLPLDSSNAVELLRIETPTQFAYAAVHLLLDTNATLLIADELFDANEVETYYGFNSETNNTKVLHQDVANGNMHAVYGIPTAQYDQLSSMFDAPRFMSATGVTVDKLLTKHTAQATFFITLGTETLELVALKDGALQVYNKYPVATDEDVLYFLVALAEQLQLDADDVSVEYYIPTGANDALLSKVPFCFKQFTPAEISPEVPLHDRLKTLPSGYCFPLLSLASCV